MNAAAETEGDSGGLGRPITPNLPKPRAPKRKLPWIVFGVVTLILVAGGLTAAALKVRSYLAQREDAARLRREAREEQVPERVFTPTPPTFTAAASAPVEITEVTVPAPIPVRGAASSRAARGGAQVAPEGAEPSRFDADINVELRPTTSARPSATPAPSLPEGDAIAQEASRRVAQVRERSAAPALPAAGAGGTELGRMLSGTATPAVKAAMVASRDFLLPRSTSIPCVLDTAIDVTLPGFVSCTVTRHIYSANGKVLLLERGSRVDGEHASGVRTGTKRVFVTWSRITTPNGVVIDVSSPATDALGRAGVEGEVDNRWGQRVGGAFLLSLIQDGVAALAAKEAGTSTSGTVVLQNTQSTGTALAGKVLDNTINIPATFAKQQGDRVNVFVARDLDFATVYGLRLDD